MKRMWVIHSWPWYWLVWPWWGGRMHWTVTGVTSDVGVPSTYLVLLCVHIMIYLECCWPFKWWPSSIIHTCQVWMWFKESNRYFCKIKIFVYGEINKALVTPTQEQFKTHIVSWRNHFIQIKICSKYKTNILSFVSMYTDPCVKGHKCIYIYI